MLFDLSQVFGEQFKNEEALFLLDSSRSHPQTKLMPRSVNHHSNIHRVENKYHG